MEHGIWNEGGSTSAFLGLGDPCPGGRDGRCLLTGQIENRIELEHLLLGTWRRYRTAG
ncbi:MAG TPA: hypothetical protein VFD71_10435 [Planctomycetota bacterium]|nr:hypothetical protein [Planctomycetota bacterium]